MGGCSKTLKFVITIITWWVGVTKKWNCPLLFVTNLWCSHFFCNFSTSQARKKGCFFYQPKAIAKGLLILDKLWNKKTFYCLAQQHCCLDKKKKNFWPRLFVFCFLHFGNSEKDKTKKRCFFFLKASVLCFGNRQTLP